MLTQPAKDRLTVLIDHLTIDILTSNEQFEGLRDEWESLFATCQDVSVFQSFLWNYVWWKHYGKGFNLAIVTVRDNKDLVGIGPFMTRIRFGKPQIEPIGGEHHYNFCLIIQTHRDDVAEAVAVKLSEYYPQGIVHIPYYTAGNYSLDILMAALNARGWKDFRWTRNISHYVYEKDGFANYMTRKSKKSRYNLKRERARLDEIGHVKLIHIGHDDLTENTVERIAQIQKKSWLFRRGQESLAIPFYIEVLPALAKKGNAEIFLYSQDGVDIAYILNLYSGSDCYCYYIGFDEAKADLSPGKSLMMDNLQVVFDRGNSVYDFLYGEGEYKRFWANRTKCICRSVSYKGLQGWLLSWYPHRLHGTFSKYQQLRILLSKFRRLKTQYFD